MENENRLHPFRNISLWLDRYDDIFSDFDPRPFSHRRLSDDFLSEVKKVCREKEENIHELIFLIPEKSRNSQEEAMITKRLRQHFRKSQQTLTVEINRLKRKGILFAFSGMVMMLISTFIDDYEKWTYNALRVLLEPSGWFLVWTGFDVLLYSSRATKAELEFYAKMTKSKITFNSI